MYWRCRPADGHSTVRWPARISAHPASRTDCKAYQPQGGWESALGPREAPRQRRRRSEGPTRPLLTRVRAGRSPSARQREPGEGVRRVRGEARHANTLFIASKSSPAPAFVARRRRWHAARYQISQYSKPLVVTAATPASHIQTSRDGAVEPAMMLNPLSAASPAHGHSFGALSKRTRLRASLRTLDGIALRAFKHRRCRNPLGVRPPASQPPLWR
jgi:hypothetical protein